MSFENQSDDKVWLGTIHSAKGLEFKVVLGIEAYDFMTLFGIQKTQSLFIREIVLHKSCSYLTV